MGMPRANWNLLPLCDDRELLTGGLSRVTVCPVAGKSLTSHPPSTSRRSSSSFPVPTVITRITARPHSSPSTWTTTGSRGSLFGCTEQRIWGGAHCVNLLLAAFFERFPPILVATRAAALRYRSPCVAVCKPRGLRGSSPVYGRPSVCDLLDGSLSGTRYTVEYMAIVVPGACMTKFLLLHLILHWFARPLAVVEDISIK